MSLIRTLTLTDTINIKVCQGSHGIYYYLEHDNPSEEEKLFPIYYDIHFPLKWVIHQKTMVTYYGDPMVTHHGDTMVLGPGKHGCNNCKYFGYYNGVFIGYCLNCAEAFEYKRGNGMLEPGLELDETMVAFDLTNYKKENSMWNTYLKDVSLNEIGDTKLYEDYEMYKDLPDLISVEEEWEENNYDKYNYDKQFPNEEEEEDYEYEYEEDKEDKKERRCGSFKDKWVEYDDYSDYDE